MSEDKAAGAFRTIGEVSEDLGLPQHILRYWETRFPQLRPLQRAGKRRYYRPDDVALVRRINRLLNQEGYTIRGVQKLLGTHPHDDAPEPAPIQPQPVVQAPAGLSAAMLAELKRIRAHLSIALVEDRA
ncbi:MerR family transcriptional regulator [Sphingomonas flavalba]|uniref:MerR family transcriptional regulator n=1 Tax=Sphingomonas flavalba TaxID=2559804 RepID=UPI0039E04431